MPEQCTTSQPSWIQKVENDNTDEESLSKQKLQQQHVFKKDGEAEAQFQYNLTTAIFSESPRSLKYWISFLRMVLIGTGAPQLREML